MNSEEQRERVEGEFRGKFFARTWGEILKIYPRIDVDDKETGRKAETEDAKMKSSKIVPVLFVGGWGVGMNGVVYIGTCSKNA